MMVTIVESWIVAWFPPEAAELKKVFRSESAALSWAASDDVAEWNPMLIHVKKEITETVVSVRGIS